MNIVCYVLTNKLWIQQKSTNQNKIIYNAFFKIIWFNTDLNALLVKAFRSVLNQIILYTCDTKHEIPFHLCYVICHTTK